jgi:hypothetical protein
MSETEPTKILSLASLLFSLNEWKVEKRQIKWGYKPQPIGDFEVNKTGIIICILCNKYISRLIAN